MIRTLDTTFPIVCLQSVGRSTSADMEVARQMFARTYARRQRVICISDARLANYDAGQRKLYTALSEQVTAMHDYDYCASNILLLDSTLLRGALTALNWLVTPRVPQYVAADGEDAVEAAHNVAHAEGIVVSPASWGQVRTWIDQTHTQAQARPQ